MRRLGSLRRAVIAAPVLLALALLAGCQATPDNDLEGELAGIAGVAAVDVDASRVKATLVDDISAADATTAIVAVRDQAVAAHSLGADVELVVVLHFGTRDYGGSAPWLLYGYGKWAGTATDEAFAQQAAFLGSLAEWETVLTSPAQILQVGFEVDAIPTEGATDAPTETPAPAEGEPAVPTQIVTVRLGQPAGSANVQADIDALAAELDALWAASGGDPAALKID